MSISVRAALAVAVTGLALLGQPGTSARAQSSGLIALSPLGASPGVQIAITGTGFNGVASRNRVAFTLPSGASHTATATAIATVDATRDWRRLTVVVPADLPTGAAALSVTNIDTGSVAFGMTLEVLHLSLPQPASAVPGATGLRVLLSASANTNLIAGQTLANLGAGVTVRQVQVLSPVQAALTIDVAATAALGPRNIILRTTNHSLFLPQGFSIANVPANQLPVANANGPYAGETGAAISFTSKGSSDPDGDPLSFAWSFGDGASSTDANPSHAYASPGTFNVALTVNDGKGGTTNSTTTAVIAQANRPPRITSSPVLSAAAGQPYAYQVTATDPDNDGLTFTVPTAPSGMTMGAAGGISWTPIANQVGPQSVSVQVADGRGGTDVQPFTIDVSAAPVVLSAIDATPATIRFAAIDATRALAVLGRRSDGSTIDVTAAATGTTYSSSHPFIASVSADGVVTAHGNGEASISVANGGLTDSVAVVVEVGVTLNSLELTPPTTTLRLVGATQALLLKGTFSDGSIRDLTASPATSFESSAAAIATVSGAGLVTAVANGQATVLAKHGDLEASAELIVSIPAGAGFVHGAVFDDSRGLPLAGATVTLLSDGGGPLTSSLTTIADDRGRYALPAQGGAVVLRIEKPGFTSVDRTITLPAGGVTRALDARLTPVDAHPNALLSAFGGQARDAAGATTLSIPPGALATDVDVRLTSISAQGLAGRLPLGWSPVGAVDIGPRGSSFSQPATLVLANTGGAPAASSVSIARYDRTVHAWVAFAQVLVSGDGRSITLPVLTGGQFAAVVPDVSPHTPPAPQPGQPLAGVDAVALPLDLTADGDVLPRSAPPGDGARAVGRIGIHSPSALPSGSVVRVDVNESFELLDATKVVPLPFGQDILVHARPRPPDGGSLGASFPITPSKNYSIQQLMRGVVNLDVTQPYEEGTAKAAGPQGAVIAGTDGETLTILAGALKAETLVHVRRVSAASATAIPQSFESLGGVEIEIIGAALALPGQLSIPLPAGLAAADQVLLVQAFIDRLGVRRMRVAGIGRIQGDRLAGDTGLGTLQFPGVTSGGQYFFLKVPTLLGFVTGVVSGADGVTAAPDVLVTSSTAPFSDVTGVSGRYIVASVAGSSATVVARHLVSADSATGLAQPAARDSVVTLPLTLALAPPQVIAISPASGATNVALDTSVTIDFSEAIDPGTISESSVSLQTGGTTVPATSVLSQDRRRLTVRPASPLAGKTTYTIVLSAALTDLSGAPLVPFVPSSFTTLDPTKPPQPPPGQLLAELPDDDGMVLIVGSAGAAEPNSAVTGTNLRTQETTTVLALADGSFRLRLPALIGDDLTLTLRDADGREKTVAITQLVGADGSTGIGQAGGEIAGAGARIGRLLPRALTQAGTFRIAEATAPAPLALAPPFAFVDRFELETGAAAFNSVAALTLTESQGRLSRSTLTDPFVAAGQLTVPADFLVNNALRFTAVAQDAVGVRRSASTSTTIVPASPLTTQVEGAAVADFPTVFVTAPGQALQNGVVQASAVAPAARIDLQIPAPTSAGAQDFLLARVMTLGANRALSLVDRLTLTGTPQSLVTSGREFPGARQPGDYVVVSTSVALAYVTGQLNGPVGVVASDDVPFVFETSSPNGRFILPVLAGQPFSLRFLNGDGSLRGTASGHAPASGSIEIGSPIAPVGGLFTVVVEPAGAAIVAIEAPIVFRFSEPVDVRSLTSGALTVTDPAGARVFGALSTNTDGTVVNFHPFRRWKFATRYRYTLTTAVTAISGARLAAAINGGFDTFTPAVISTAPIGTARDVATTPGLALVATDGGAQVVDLTSPLSPQARAQVAGTAAAGGVAMLGDGTVTNRDGQAVQPPVGFVISGTPATSIRVDSVDLRTPVTPAVIGSTRVSDAGLTAAAAAIAVDASGAAFASLGARGGAVVHPGEAIPVDAANPGRGLGARYPDSGAEHVSQAAFLPGRVVLAGAAGITSLDASTLTVRGRTSTDGQATGIAALPAVQMDLDGDGRISLESEVLDLAIVTGGSDGTVQFYRVPDSGAPVLLSVVRVLNATTTGVTVDAAEQLAYVTLGARGLGIVDLAGPASVQPIDVDRDGVDDRVLGTVDTRGTANRVAMVPGRGLGAVANGAAGLAVLQLAPPRTRFVTLARDPIVGRSGDEESLLGGASVLTTDEGISVSLDVSSTPQTSLVLTIEDRPESGPARLAFTSGAATAALQDGLNAFTLVFNPAIAPVPGVVTLRVSTSTGASVASVVIRVQAPSTVDATVLGLTAAPNPARLAPGQLSLQLSVGAVTIDGRMLNVTRDPETAYVASDPVIASVSSDGLVTPRAGGTTSIGVTYRGHRMELALTVDALPAPVAIETRTRYVTLTSPGQQLMIPVTVRMSDGSLLDFFTGLATFQSLDPSVVTVDQNGRLTAVGQGRTSVRIVSGNVTTDVFVAGEFRVPAVLTGLSVAAPTSAVNAGEGTTSIRARVAGTGSLEGLPVLFEIVGTTLRFTALTDFEGIAVATAQGLRTPGQFSIRASVTNPATGTDIERMTTVTVVQGGRDAEPNDTVANAPLLARLQSVVGTLGGGDSQDIYRTESRTAGTIRVRLTLSPETVLATVQVRFLDANGVEIARRSVGNFTQTFDQTVPGGAAFVVVESIGGAPVGYRVELGFTQAPITITAVSPLAGPAGTPVVIQGTNFHPDAGQTRILFGGVLGKVLGTTSDRIEALVPANALDGAITVESGTRHAVGPAFSAGRTSLPEPSVKATDPDNIRFDPATGVTVDVSRLALTADPVATRAAVEGLVSPLGGTIIGVVPAMNFYYVEFSANTTLAGIATIRRQLAASPLVTGAVRDVFADAQAFHIDARDNGLVFTGTSVSTGTAYDAGRIFDAIEAIRSTPPFDDPANLSPVRIGVIDSGFAPAIATEFQFQGQSLVTAYRAPANVGAFNSNLTGVDQSGHGTMVTGVISAVNDGAGTSGVLNSLYASDEQPKTQTFFFGIADPLSGKLSSAQGLIALSTLAGFGNIDAVNMSYRATWAGDNEEFQALAQNYRDAFALFGGRSVIVPAAGNDGLDARFTLPAALSESLDYVMTAGASAVANVDGSGEGRDARAIFNNTGRLFDQGIQCRIGIVGSESNCGTAVSLAAPGEDIYTTFTAASASGYKRTQGTSFAAPILSAVVGIIQAIRAPGSVPMGPGALRDLLVDSADDVSDPWDYGSMRRLNALNAVRSLLRTSDTQLVYIADQDAPGGAAPGRIVGIDVDPLDGKPILPATHVSIPLTFTAGGTTFTGTRPTALAMAPGGEKFYAVVRSVTPSLGDGVLLINTRTNQAEAFIPFSGASFPVQSGAPPPPPNVTVASLRPGMAFSRDGRLLYVATGLEITIVNTAEERVVRTFADLPAAYKSLSAQQSPTAFATRLAALRAAVTAGVAGRPGTVINGLTLSPDGRRLYAAIGTGGGGGTQPGGIIGLDVDLYTDADPSTPGLQSELGSYLTIVTPAVLPMLAAGQPPGGDEPGAVAVTPNGRHLLLVNGGLNFFESIPADTLDLGKYGVLLMGPIAMISGGSSALALVSAMGAFESVSTSLYNELLLDIKQQAASGLTLIGAPGFTGVFSPSGPSNALQPSWLFSSDVTFGWNPSPSNGGSIINQFRFRDVFAKRPFDIAISPLGHRAVVPFFQTGNIGVLDLERQAQFLAPPGSTPRAGLSAVSPEFFHGVVAVTPAIRFDNHLWPRRGAFYSPGTTDRMPSPDDNLLYAWDTDYAQNGRFSVTTHTGTGVPRPVTGILGDFVNDVETRAALVGLRATFDGTNVSWTEEDGTFITAGVGQSVTLKRGGGAVSIVNDAAIDASLTAHIGATAAAPDGTLRPYFATLPIEDAVTTLKRYTPAGGQETTLYRPRGVVIQPFVAIESPRFGDHVTLRQPVYVTWRDDRAVGGVARVMDPAQVDTFGIPTVTLREATFQFSDSIRARRSFSVPFANLFTGLPVEGRRYRIEFEISTATEVLSSTYIDVVFDDRSDPITVDTEALHLTPRLNFFATVPTGGAGKALTLIHEKPDGQADEDVSASAAVVWQSIDLGLAEAEIPGFGSLKEFLRGKLQQAGVTVPFDLAKVEVVSGRLRATSGGVQAVRGCLPGGLCSNPILVIAGIELDSVEFAPTSIINATIGAAQFAANNLTERFKTLELNPPMILAADDTAIALDKGLVLLENVTLKFLGGPGTLSLQDLYEGVGRVLATAGPLALKEKIALELVKLAVGQTAGFLPFESANANIAALAFGDVPGLRHVVQSGQPGITQVTGTLDLTSIGLGDATDSVLVWVLPQVEAAEIEPQLTTVNLNTPAAARPLISTFARTSVLQEAILFEVPERYASFAQYVDKVLPPSWKTLQTGERTYSFNDNLRVSVSFNLALEESASRIALRDLKLGFTTPNLFNTYTLGSPSIASLDSQGTVSTTHAVRPLAKGETAVANHVDLGILGEVDARPGVIKVCDGQGCEEFTLELQKKLLFMQSGEACSQTLKVRKTLPNGEVEDVTAHEDTTYYSLRQLTDSGVSTVAGVNIPALDSLVQQAVQKIKDKLQAAIGAPVPFAHGKVSISDDGRVTVEEDGLEIIWATHAGRITNFSVILSGFKLDSIDLQPLSLLTPPVESETGQKLLEKINQALETELKPNAPMVLIDADENTDFSFLTRKGQVIIRDAKFKVLGQSEIGVRDVLGAVEDFLSPIVRGLIRAELGTGQVADLSSKVLTSVLFELVEFGLEEGATQLLDFEIEQGEDVVSLTTDILDDLAPKGIVTAKKPGIAVVKATLNLGDECGAGKKDDQISIWVLPGLDTLELKPQHTVVTKSCTTAATAKVKSIMCSAPFPDAVLSLPEEVETIGEFASRVLPSSLQPPVPGQLPVDHTFTAGDFEFRVKGTIAVNFSDIRLAGLTFCTTVPNGIDGQTGVPGISNTYTFVNPAIGEIAAVNPFSVLFREKGVLGTTDVQNHVEVFAINDNLNASGTFTVVDAACGDEILIEKVLASPAGGNAANLAPGSIAEYVVRVGNLGAEAVEAAAVADTPTFETPAGVLIAGNQPQLLTCVVPGALPGAPACVIPRIEPGEIVAISVFVEVPLQGPADARLCNTALVNGESARVCNETAHTSTIAVTKRLIDPATGAPDPTIDPSGEPVLNPGTTVQYEITVTNTGSAREENITLTDTASHLRTVNGQPVRTTLHTHAEPAFALDPGATKTILVSVPTPVTTDCRTGSSIENRAAPSVGSAAETLHRMKCVPDLQIEKALVDPPIPSGQPIAGTAGPLKRVTYEIRVTNSGSGIAETVVVQDDPRIVGPGIDQSMTPFGLPICTFTDLAPGESDTCRVQVTFGAEATGNALVNTARVITPGGGPTAQTTHPVVPEKLKVTKELVSASFASNASGAPELILAGTAVTYKITVKNVGVLPVEGATLTDLAIAGSQVTGTTVRFNQPFSIPTLAPGEDFEQEVTFAVPASDAGRQLLNRASVDVEGADPAEVRHDIVAASLIVSKRLIDPAGGILADLVRGSPATYELTVTNAGGAPAADVSLLDTVSIEGSIIRGPTLIPIGALAAGESRTTLLSFTVPTLTDVVTPCVPVAGIGCPPLALVSPRLTNLLQVQSGDVPGVVTTTTNTVVNPTLSVTKTLVEPGTGAPIPGGSSVTYRIVVVNTDSVTARGVELTDIARVGTTRLFEGTFALGALAPGERREQLVRFRVPLGFDGRTLENSATVNFRHLVAKTSHPIVDPTVEITKRLVRLSPGVLDITGQAPLLLGGSSVDYVVTVTNRGTVASAAMTLTDTAVLERRGPDGAVASTTTLATQALSVGVLQPSTSQSFTVSVPVPLGANGATLVNRVVPSIAGLGVVVTENVIVEPTVSAGLFITEVLIDPQQDWNDTSGGNGVAFDGTPGTGAVDLSDIWIEITRPTTATQNWKVVLTDELGETSEKTFGTAPTDAAAVVKVLGGFETLTGPVAKVEVVDDTDTVRQSINVAALRANYALAEGSATEAFVWSIHGIPSAVIQQFVRGLATPGVFRPF